MQSQLTHISEVLNDVQAKTTTIVTQLRDAKTQITDLQTQLADASVETITNDDLEKLADQVNKLDSTVTDALQTATAPAAAAPDGGSSGDSNPTT